MKTNSKQFKYISSDWEDFYEEFLNICRKEHETENFFYLRRDWENFYRQYFGLEVDLSEILVPQCSKENYYLLFMIKVTPQFVYDVWNNKRRTEKSSFWGDSNYDLHDGKFDLDKEITLGRNTTESYAVWVQGGKRPVRYDYNSYSESMTINSGITLLEQMVFQSNYYFKTGNLLDKKITTLCDGSRDREGCIPSIGYNGSGILIINQSNPTYDFWVEKGRREIVVH